MTLKHSSQRDSILEFLKTRKDHPTADVVYMNVRKSFPNISLGTVYRNLNLLADIGEIVKIPTPDGGDRFDGRTDSHYHVVCSNCGNVFDLELDPSFDQFIDKTAGEKFNGVVDSHNILFYGKCTNCCSNINKKSLK